MNNNYGVREFNKTIVKYFMDFIETDFHKRSAPKKKIIYTNSENLVVGCNLSKFNKISDKISKLLNNSLDSKIVIKKGDYNSNLSSVSKVKAKERFRISCESNIKNSSSTFIKSVENCLKNADLASSDSALKEEIKNNLILLTKKPITEKYFEENEEFFINNGIQEEEITSLEESLEASIISNFEDDILELIEKRNKNPKIKAKEVAGFITYDRFSKILDNFLENLSVNDLFFELEKMNSSKKMLENQAFYLSIFDISFNKIKYPIFYIPFSLEENKEDLEIEFGSQLYINKKAIEFIIQELKENIVLIGKIESITERIIYLADCQTPGSKILQIIGDIMNFFSFKENFNDEFNIVNSYKNEFINISNNMYFNIFDTSDDALVNDYEELLQSLNLNDSEIGNFFENLIYEFMEKDPQSINKIIEENWDKKEIDDKLLYPAPVPLNEEQIKILQAIGNRDCKYISVQGPPGTGKSHTITAIIFDMILKNKSVLVLSDKKEALDVVEDKITSTLNEVRIDSDFQNPVLRLGKSGGTYSKILSKTSIENIKASYKATKNKKDEISEKINKIIYTIKDDIKLEEEYYDKIKLKSILEVEYLDNILNSSKYIDLDELNSSKTIEDDMHSINKIIDVFTSEENNNEYFSTLSLYNINYKDNNLLTKNLTYILSEINKYDKYINYIKDNYQNGTAILLEFSGIEASSIKYLKNAINNFKKTNTIFNKIFNKEKIYTAIREVKKYYSDFDFSDKDTIHDLETFFELYEYIHEKDDNENSSFNILIKVLSNNNINENLKFIRSLIDEKNNFINLKQHYINSLSCINENNLFAISNEIAITYKNYLRFILEKKKLESIFINIPISKYLIYKNEMQSLITTQTAMIMDERVIDFCENYSNSAATLKKIIQSKKKFPKSEFNKLKNAFPCILAGIRDYAEYIPLEPQMFDLVIIDEASQVSIAQALPALIRAKKVLVLGDKKQFSNVKSNNAKNEINNEYKNSIKRCFMQCEYANITTDAKLEYFDIKSSILEFFEHISNYQAMLYKYFRGYDAIISYSNKFFYQNKLQVMKIRGKSINEVLKFKIIKYDGLKEMIPKTNTLEYEFIKNKILELLNSNYSGSIGIITPHTNQQRYIYNELRKLQEYQNIEKRFNLKVMTFDSCQGEERDIIFYSMVATEYDDKLYGVFPKNLDDIDSEDEGNLRAQRLNVGFSRAKECMYFVLSKDVSKFNGEIGVALNFYKNYLETALKEKSTELTDSKSPQESLIMKYFYETDFWKENSDEIEFMPQFQLGKYLKQLDPNYNHPLYCVDFLLLYKNDIKTHKIIIEYDGFKEHFEDLLNVDKDNYNDYYKADDIYRQKVLESYGYEFLRINKFNIGSNPVRELNARLNAIVNTNNSYTNTFKDSLFEEVQGIKDKTKKECPKCNRILDISYFKDESLLSGIGKICKDCKSKRSEYTDLSESKCPKCGSKLEIKNGRYGKFVGCTRYPYCNYTRNL